MCPSSAASQTKPWTCSLKRHQWVLRPPLRRRHMVLARLQLVSKSALQHKWVTEPSALVPNPFQRVMSSGRKRLKSCSGAAASLALALIASITPSFFFPPTHCKVLNLLASPPSTPPPPPPWASLPTAPPHSLSIPVQLVSPHL